MPKNILARAAKVRSAIDTKTDREEEGVVGKVDNLN
jgi:hypothetical protein